MYQSIVGGSFESAFASLDTPSPSTAPIPPIVTPPTISPEPVVITQPTIKECKVESKPTTVYESTAVKLTISINQWILHLNRVVIENIQKQMETPKSFIHCLVGQSGCGKSVIIQYILRKHTIPFMIYDSFADYGSTEKDMTKQGDGCLTYLLETNATRAIVLDGIDGCGKKNLWFARSLRKQYQEFKSYLTSTKFIFITVESLQDFGIRTWLRDVQANIYYVKDRMTVAEKTQLTRHIHSRIPLASTYPIEQFVGDFRRMGIDLISCTMEAKKYGNNTNATQKAQNIFGFGKQLLGFPRDALPHPMILDDDPSKVLQFMLANQVNRVSDQSSTRADVMDELARTAHDLSDIVDMSHVRDGVQDDDIHWMLLPHRSTMLAATDRMDCVATTAAMVASNKRLGSHLRSTWDYSVQFLPSIYLRQSWTPNELNDPTREFPPKEKT